MIRLAPGSAPRNGLPEPRGYVYRGDGTDQLTGFMDRQPARPRPPGLKTGPGRPRAPHGSMSAVRRHQRHKEPLCDPCRLEKNRVQNERRRGGRSMSAEHEAARIRDIPRSCACEWTYSYRLHRWVWDGYREHCPWHGGHEGRAA